jgi:hypothetical protein
VSVATAKTWRAGDGWHIDVRGLPAPQPLVAILRLIESVADATPVVAHLERDPQMLYPELAERGWVAERIEGEPGEVRLRLAPASGDDGPAGGRGPSAAV